MFDNLMDFLSKADVIVGLVSAIFSVMVFFQIKWLRNSRYKEWKREATSMRGDRPAVLLVDLHKTGVISEMETSLQKDLPSANIGEDRIFRIQLQKDLSPDDMPEIVSKIRGALAEMTRVSASERIVYFAGPFPVSLVLGAELANTGSVKIMHRSQKPGGNTYENWGGLRHPVL